MVWEESEGGLVENNLSTCQFAEIVELSVTPRLPITEI